MKFVNHDEMLDVAGIRVLICTRTEFKNEQWQSTVPAGFWIGIILGGCIETNDANNGRQTWKANTKHAFWSDGTITTEHKIMTACEPFVAIFIHITTPSSLDLFNQEELNTLQQFRSPMILESTSIERTLAWRILGTKTQGLERKLYIASRAIDLVSNVVTSFCRSDRPSLGSVNQVNLSPKEMERIYALSNDLLSKPSEFSSTQSISRLVGMSVRKINTAFRILYGVTMYGFIIQSRLDQARSLLEAGEHNVAQVADFVGYDPAHFSTAFRKRFGQPPSAYSKLIKK
tara:strand:+ start:858 stop:1721 length:864 start_codon:yes stop_codon:yes gene_type:complete